MDITFAKSSQSLKALTPVLNEWNRITVEYADGNPGDSCWSYNERATLSTLAGAAWKKGWFALEEFGTEKHTGERDAETGVKLNGYGRCDLYLSNGSKDYVVEAKQAWQAIGPNVLDLNGQVKKKLKSSFRDVGAVPKQEGDSRLALTFVAPSFPVALLDKAGQGNRSRAERSTEIITAWLVEVRRMSSIDAMAWAFPKTTRCLTNEDETRVFPGVVALIRERKRAAKVTG